MRNVTRGSAVLRSLTALTLAICLLISALPMPQASAAAATSPLDLTRSATKTYFIADGTTTLFTGDTYGDGTVATPDKGEVLQLYSTDHYAPGDGKQYYRVYYESKLYNALYTDVNDDIMNAATLQLYITGSIWNQTVHGTLRESMDLVGDIRVHAVQLALQRLGYYKGNLDGDYGAGTHNAVQAFQRANNLDPDGSAGPLTQPVLFALASGSSTVNGGSSTGTSSSSGTLRTTASVNLRKRATTSSARLAVVPKSVNLSYTDTTVRNGVTWYQVTYNKITGWLMGTFVNATGSSSSGSSSGSSSSVAIGTVTITEPKTRVRKTPGGDKTGYVLAKGAVVDLLSQPTTQGGYTWYHIRTGSGLVGYVRGDCAEVTDYSDGSSSSGGSSALVPSVDKTFVKLPAATALFKTDTKPASGSVIAEAGTVLMMVTSATYTVDGVAYCSLYYDNETYNAVYAEISAGIMTVADVAAHLNTLLSSALPYSLKRELDLVGDVHVYALQVALYNLGYYTGKLDGSYGSGTASAVRNFQRKYKLEVDGQCGAQTWATLQSVLNGVSVGGGSSGITSGGIVVPDFGTVSKVVKASWDYDDFGAELFKRDTYATVMDVATGKVFNIFRWAGANHADCVPASLNDTKIMCDIVGYNFDGSHPNSSQLSSIKADNANGHANYTWPDFNGNMGGKNIGSDWDRRPALLNVNGTVYPVSIYGYPHGYTGADAFASAKFPDGSYFYSKNAYYGMMCIHFVGSKTHGGSSPNEEHQKAIDKAWEYAKTQWPSLCK